MPVYDLLRWNPDDQNNLNLLQSSTSLQTRSGTKRGEFDSTAPTIFPREKKEVLLATAPCTSLVPL